MLTIICGEDTVASRAYLSSFIQTEKQKGTEIIYLEPPQIFELARGTSDSLHLFSRSILYHTQNLESAGFRKSTAKKKDLRFESLLFLAKDPLVHILDWEIEKASRELRLKDFATIKEFKPKQSIFSFLDICIPGNKDRCLRSLSVLTQTEDIQFIFIMLNKHIRSLLLAKNSFFSNKLASWQKSKLLSQSKAWKETTLLSFYAGLIKIELSTKSGANPYGIQKSLEILFCHYL